MTEPQLREHLKKYACNLFDRACSDKYDPRTILLAMQETARLLLGERIRKSNSFAARKEGAK